MRVKVISSRELVKALQRIKKEEERVKQERFSQLRVQSKANINN